MRIRCAAALVFAAMSCYAGADAYPSRPIRFLVPGAPGSSQVYKLQAKMVGYPGSLRADTSSHWWMQCEFYETLA